MSREFAAKLIERVLMTFVGAFVATYLNVLIGASSTPTPVLGQVGDLLKTLEDLSLLHKAVAAGLLALFQMAASVLIGSRVGDKNSPDLVPSRFLGGGAHEAVPVGRYSTTEEFQHLLQQTAASDPTAPLSTDAVLAAIKATKEPDTSAT